MNLLAIRSDDRPGSPQSILTKSSVKRRFSVHTDEDRKNTLQTLHQTVRKHCGYLVPKRFCNRITVLRLLDLVVSVCTIHVRYMWRCPRYFHGSADVQTDSNMFKPSQRPTRCFLLLAAGVDVTKYHMVTKCRVFPR